MTVLTTTSRQSQDSSRVAITTLQAQLESTMAISEELKRAKDQQAQALSDTQTAVRNHIAEQSRMLNEKMALHEREQQRKAAEDKQILEDAAKDWKAKLEKEVAEKMASDQEQLRVANQRAQ